MTNEEFLQKIDQELASLDKNLLIKEIPDFLGKDFNPSKYNCGNDILLNNSETK